MPMTKHEIEQLLREPNIAVVSVSAPDGAPHAVPTWYEYQDGAILFHTAASAFKYKCLVHDPRIAFCIDMRKPPYKAVILKGRVSMEQKVDGVRLERMAVHYLGERDGKAYAKTIKNDPVVVVSFKPERTISWDYGKESP